MSGLLVLLALAIGIGAVLYLIKYKKRSLVLQRSISTVLFRIALPRIKPVNPGERETYQQLVREQIAVMEQLYTAFSRMHAKNIFERFLLGPEHATFEIAIPATGEEIAFYISVPKHLSDETEKVVHAVYATAYVERINDYNIFHPYGVAAGATLTLKHHPALPIRTYQEIEADPLQGITTALSKLSEMGEGAAMQILIRPSHGRVREHALRIARQMYKSGCTFARAKYDLSWGGALLKIILPNPNSNQHGSQQQGGMLQGAHGGTGALTPRVQETVKAVEDKASKPLFSVNIRLLTAAESPAKAEQTLNQLAIAFQQFDAPNLNGFRINIRRKAALKRLAFLYAFRIFNKNQVAILSTAELTSLLHFPNLAYGMPSITYLKAKPSEPPPNLPKEGLLLGTNQFRGIETFVRLSEADRRRHLYVIGQTGTGKTSMMKELIRQDIEAGRGVGVIDPHGDLAEDVLKMTPASRADDVVYFNPGDTEMPLGLNILEWQTEEQKDFVVQEMVRIFEKLFPPEVIGPMFEHNMRNAMLTLMADKENPGTIVEIPRIFTDNDFVKKYLDKVTDPIVRSFWEQEMAKTSDFHRSEMLGYLISKVGRFVENAMMRNIIGQAHSSFDLREIMDSGKIFIANLSKGKVGEVNASLLGLVLVGKIQMAAMARADSAEETRRDFYFYIDEFQNFTTDSIATILSEARKYRLNLIIAHQFIAQLDESIRDAVFGNAGSIVSFRVGPTDAEFLEKQFVPIFTQEDLISIDNFNAYIRMMVNGVAERPFNIAAPKPKEGNAELGEKIREYSRLKYGRPKVEVEQEILERSQLGSGASSEQNMQPGERNM